MSKVKSKGACRKRQKKAVSARVVKKKLARKSSSRGGGVVEGDSKYSLPSLKAIDITRTIVSDNGFSHPDIKAGEDHIYIVKYRYNAFDVGYFSPEYDEWDFDENLIFYGSKNDSLELNELKGIWKLC